MIIAKPMPPGIILALSLIVTLHSLLLANLYHAVYMHPSAAWLSSGSAANNSQQMDSYICHFASRQVSVATSSLKLDEIMRVLWMIIVF